MVNDITIKNEKTGTFITEIKLAINQKLYESKHITAEMYLKAKEMILKT